MIELQKQQTREKYNKVVTASQRKEQREFPKRFIYFVVDGQDILDSADLLFSFVEVVATKQKNPWPPVEKHLSRWNELCVTLVSIAS